jgi:putative exporter of polyketide antibiotics
MIALPVLFLLLAVICFVVGAINKLASVNWLCAGLACLTLVLLTGGHL